MSYRNELDQQFLWNSLQAVEKYLKAILLYNGRSSKGIKHNIVKGLELVSAIDDIQFVLPDDVLILQRNIVFDFKRFQTFLSM